LAIFSGFGREKQSQFVSVLRSADCVEMRKRNLKKQTQFVSARIGARLYIKGDYTNITALGARKNKANFRPRAGQNQLKPGMSLAYNAARFYRRNQLCI
jgi:hypothetical protein